MLCLMRVGCAIVCGQSVCATVGIMSACIEDSAMSHGRCVMWFSVARCGVWCVFVGVR